MLPKNVVEEFKTHIVCPMNFFISFENLTVCEIMWKNIVEARQATDDNMTHTHCILDT